VRFDVILVTYDVLTTEKWRSLAQTQRARRQPIPYKALLMELDLWRVVLDEVQYAQGGRGAGQMVRMLTAQHRWAVSGTPMRPNTPSDLTHLLNFVCGATWLAKHSWEALVRGIDERQGKDRLVQKLKPLFLRRTKAEVDAQLNIPPQRSRVRYVTPTYAEEMLRDEFVHRSALRLSEKASSQRAPTVAEDQACEELSDDVLSKHQRVAC
jgi:SNF2 family DNA or RNA helicase